jgi:uncharacterized SAM-binding protein YcdF (DUF218 family)
LSFPFNRSPSIIEQLQKKGVPKRALDGENCSLTTVENAFFSAAVLQAQGIRQIILITDEPYMWRSLLVYRAHGFTVIPQTTPLPSYMSFKEKIFITVRELAGLVGYGLRGLYLKQTSPESTSPEIVDLVKKAQQYGKQRSLK